MLQRISSTIPSQKQIQQLNQHKNKSKFQGQPTTLIKARAFSVLTTEKPKNSDEINRIGHSNYSLHQPQLSEYPKFDSCAEP